MVWLGIISSIILFVCYTASEALSVTKDDKDEHKENIERPNMKKYKMW